MPAFWPPSLKTMMPDSGVPRSSSNQLPQRLAKPSFRADRREQFRPIDGVAVPSRGVSVAVHWDCPPRALAPRRRLAPGRQLVEREDPVAFQVFIELVDRHVVDLAKPREEIGIRQRLGHLLRLNGSLAAASVGVGKPHAQTGVDQDHRPRVSHLLPLRPPVRLQVEGQQAEERRQPQAVKQPAPSRPQFHGIAPVHVPDEEQDRPGKTAIGAIQSLFEWMRAHSNVVRERLRGQQQERRRSCGASLPARTSVALWRGSWPTRPGAVRRSATGSAHTRSAR